MHVEYLRIIAFKASTGGVIAQCLETNQLSTGRQVDVAIQRSITANVALLVQAEEVDMGLFSPAPAEIWELYRPTMTLARTSRRSIAGKYDAIFRCYDLTNAENPMDI